MIGVQVRDGLLTARDEVVIRVGGGSSAPMLSVASSGEGLVLKFNAAAGRPHAVQVCTDLSGGVWSTFEEIPAISRPSTLQVSVPLSTGARFFRVLVR